MRGVLALFEGRPPAPPTATPEWRANPPGCCCTLGPGLGNGLLNLHNARRAHPDGGRRRRPRDRPLRYDAPLESDIDAVARTVSGTVIRGADTAALAADTAAAIGAARAGAVATLILPADVHPGPTAARRR